MAKQTISPSDFAVFPLTGSNEEAVIKVLEYGTPSEASAVRDIFDGSTDPVFTFDEPTGQQRQLSRGEILFLHDIGRHLILVLRHGISMPYPWNPLP